MPSALLLVGGAGVTVAAITAGTPLPGWSIAFVSCLILGALATLDAFGLVKDGPLGPRKPAEDRVRDLVAALSESTKVMAEIEREVKARGELADRLQADVKRHEELLKLNRAEVEAVAQTFRTEVHREGMRGFWYQAVLNVIFFAAGVLVTLIFGR